MEEEVDEEEQLELVEDGEGGDSAILIKTNSPLDGP